jgi:2-oxoglutarate dehydrogenase E2 component (dihydrolipoamide succinyltransferase)
MKKRRRQRRARRAAVRDLDGQGGRRDPGAPRPGMLKEIRVQPGTGTVAINTVVGITGLRRGWLRRPLGVAHAPRTSRAAAPRCPFPHRSPRRLPRRPVPAARPKRCPQSDAGPRAPSSSSARAAPPRNPRSCAAAPRSRATALGRRAAPAALVAGRAQDRGRAQRGHPRDPGHRHLGRVTKQDILGHLETKPAARPACRPAPRAVAARRGSPRAPTAPPAPPPRRRTGVQVVPMSPIRRKTAEHMVQSKRIVRARDHVFEIDMTRVDQLRRSHRRVRGAQRRQAHLPAVHPEGDGRRAEGRSRS